MKKENKNKKKIWIIANTKGGVGKSLTSIVVACLLHAQGKKFKIIEIDDNNDSLGFKKSEFIKSENAVSFKLNKKDEALSDMFFDLMAEDDMNYIIDIGGGNDTQIVELLKSTNIPKKYIIPTSRIKKYIKNADDTFEMIDDPENTIFLLNQYSDIENIEEEFIYFFGNEKFGIEKESKNFNKENYLTLPLSNSFQFAEDQDMSILDLASVSANMTQDQAMEIFYKKAKGDRQKYHRMLVQYWQSEEASKTFKEIEKNFKKIFE